MALMGIALLMLLQDLQQSTDPHQNHFRAS
jgi:hypothetical protein